MASIRTNQPVERTLVFKGRIKALEELLLDLAQQLVQQKASIVFGLSSEHDVAHLVEETVIGIKMSVNNALEVTYTESYEPDINGLCSDAANSPPIKARTPNYFAPTYSPPKELSETEKINEYLRLKAPENG